MKRILLVDDAPDYLRILAQVLEQDFEVHTAIGVSEALSQIEKMDMDLICSDLQMRDGTGLDILISLRENHSEVPFILMSGKADCPEIKMAAHYGAIFIPKTSSNFVMQIKNIAEKDD